MDVGELQRQFATAKFLSFDEANGLVRVHVAASMLRRRSICRERT